MRHPPTRQYWTGCVFDLIFAITTLTYFTLHYIFILTKLKLASKRSKNCTVVQFSLSLLLPVITIQGLVQTSNFASVESHVNELLLGRNLGLKICLYLLYFIKRLCFKSENFVSWQCYCARNFKRQTLLCVMWTINFGFLALFKEKTILWIANVIDVETLRGTKNGDFRQR